MSAQDPQTDREWIMRIDGKVDQLTTEMREFVRETKERRRNCDHRLEDLETFRNDHEGQEKGVSKMAALVYGGMATIGVLISVLINFWPKGGT